MADPSASAQLMSAKVALVASGDDVRDALVDAFEGSDFDITVTQFREVGPALETLASERHAACIVRSRATDLSDAYELTRQTKKAGLRVPVIVLMDLASSKHESVLIEAGAIAAIPWDGSQEIMLRNVVRLAMVTVANEEKLRESNDRLIREFATMQDMRERAEALTAEHVVLLEEAVAAKGALQELNKEKDKFFSIVAHDLKNPFNSIIGFSEMIEKHIDTLGPEEVREYAANIHSSASQIYKLLENLLDWARIQMNRIDLSPEPFLIYDAIENVLDVYEGVAKRKGVEIVTDESTLQAFADQQIVETIIRNLVSNAVKFTPAGGIVTIETSEAGDGAVVVCVKDTGTGMDRETLSKLFKISENVSTLGTAGESGTGLGLTLCKELARRSDGDLRVESELGHGSAFYLVLPKDKPPRY